NQPTTCSASSPSSTRNSSSGIAAWAQAAAAAAAYPARGHGAARPCPAGAGSAHQITGDERGDDRSGVAGYPAASGNGNAPPVGSFGGDQAQRAGARTFADWDDPPPGFVEADLVAHSGPVARGSFVQTLVLTDIATGWTECAPLLVREQRLLTEVLGEIRKLLPFPLLGLDNRQRQRVHERDCSGLLRAS